MQQIDTINWKEVKIIDLFEVKRGNGIVTKYGEYPLITAKSTNNGIGGLTTSPNFSNSITVSANGTNTGTAFYQENEFGAISDVNILIEKVEIKKLSKLFLATVMTKTFTPKYNYGKKLGTERLNKESIFLPHKNNNIDWEWIENYMAELNSKLPAVRKFKNGQDIPIDTSNWKSFNLIDLFDINISKKCLGEFDCWEVTGQTTNNGRRKKYQFYNQENIFTIVSVGNAGTAFWHPYKFWLGNNVQGYKPKFNVSNNIGIFLSVIMTKTFTPKYTYGKPASIERISKETIFLPSKNNQPDWEYMEEFINTLSIN